MSMLNVNTPINNKFINKNSSFLQNNSNPLDLQKNFLSLLMAQIKNQDPTDPIKNTELTSQLAQINTASGIEKLNNTVGTFSNQIRTHKNIQVSSLIGHRVMIINNQLLHSEGTETKFGVELINHATKVTITITDNNDKVIYTKNINNVHAGTYSFPWNGKDLSGNNIGTGKYYVSVVAQNQDKDVPCRALTEAKVNSIIISSNADPIIDLGVAGTTELSNIREIL